MILAINIGNTNTVLGCIDGSKCVFVERISTVKTKTELEYAIDIKNVLDIYHIKKADLEGGIISSVVPQITMVVKAAVEKILKKEVLIVGAGIKTGLNIRIDNPAQLGSDLVVGAVAGIAEYPTPLLIFDMGTANTVCVIDKNRNYIGGMIYPGIGVSLDSLTANASQLGGDQSGRTGAYYRKKYGGLYEKRYRLQQRCGDRRVDRSTVRRSGRRCNGSCDRGSGGKNHSSLQKKDYSRR